MATIKDIADYLGVSCSTVSRALNHNSRISIGTQKKVFEAARLLQYSVSERPLQKVPKLIGIITAEIISTNYSAMVSAIEANLERRGYAGIIGVTNFQKETEKKWLDTFEQIGVEGIIVLMNNDADSIDLLMEYKKTSSIPVMQINNFEEYSEYDSLMVSNVLAAKQIADHLASLGHREIAILSDQQSARRAEEIRKQLVCREMSVLDDRRIIVTDRRFELAGYEAMERLAQQAHLPTAIVATYDYLAFGILKYCDEHDIRIPEDVSLISIDNVNSSAYMQKALTTVSMPAADAGRIATRIMIDRIESGNVQGAIQHVSLNPVLIVRDTTAAPKKP